MNRTIRPQQSSVWTRDRMARGLRVADCRRQFVPARAWLLVRPGAGQLDTVARLCAGEFGMVI